MIAKAQSNSPIFYKFGLERSFRSSHQRCSIKNKKRLWHRCFPMNFAKFLRAPFLQNISRRLLLWFIVYKPITDIAEVFWLTVFFISVISFCWNNKHKSSARSIRPEVFCKKVVLEILQNSQENTCAKFFFNKVAGLSRQLY